MFKRLLLASLLCLLPLTSMAATSTIDGLTSAATPLTGAERAMIVQGSTARKTLVSDMWPSVAGDCTVVKTTTLTFTCLKTNNVAFTGLATAAIPLSEANGGSGVTGSAFNNNAILYQSSLGTFRTVATMTDGQLVFGNTGNDPAVRTVTGDLAFSNTGVATIAADAVSNAKLADAAANSIKCNNTGGALNPIDCTVAQTKTLLGVTTVGTATVGQIPGVASNTAATAGNSGETLVASRAIGSAVSLTTNTDTDVTSQALTAGDWLVYGYACFTRNASTSTTVSNIWLSTTSASQPADYNDGTTSTWVRAASIANVIDCRNVGPIHVITSSTPTVYLSVKDTFTASTTVASGRLTAVRIR